MYQKSHLTSVTIQEITDLEGFVNTIHDYTNYDGRFLRSFWRKMSQNLPLTLFTDQEPQDPEVPCHSFFAYNNRIHNYAKIKIHTTFLWTENVTGKPIPEDDPRVVEYNKAKAWYDNWLSSLTEEEKHYLDIVQSQQARRAMR